MIYNPDSINIQGVEGNILNAESFLDCQIKYRESFEAILKEYIDFKKYDNYLKNLDIPILNDFEINFYHKYSTLGSKYLYLRNNFHIENLTKNEISQIIWCIGDETLLPLSFLVDTFNRVLFEQGQVTFFNYAVPDNAVLSKSFVFEFAYDLLSCNELQKIKDIKKYIVEIFEKLKNDFSRKTSIPISCIVYTATPNIYHKMIK